MLKVLILYMLCPIDKYFYFQKSHFENIIHLFALRVTRQLYFLELKKKNAAKTFKNKQKPRLNTQIIQAYYIGT